MSLDTDIEPEAGRGGVSTSSCKSELFAFGGCIVGGDTTEGAAASWARYSSLTLVWCFSSKGRRPPFWMEVGGDTNGDGTSESGKGVYDERAGLRWCNGLEG